MSPTVKLTVLTGGHQGERYVLRGPTMYTVGRDPDCEVSLNGTPADQLISRRHCRLQVDPPIVRVQDLGSRNGTFVNGRTVPAHGADEQQSIQFESKTQIGTLHPGDVLTIGGTSLRVDVVEGSAPKAGDAAHEARGCDS